MPIIVGCCLTAISNIAAAQLGPLNRLGTGLIFNTLACVLLIGGVYIGWNWNGVIGVAWFFLISRVGSDTAFDGVDVKRIVVHTSKRAVEHNGDPNPRETMAAQYSIPYCAGAAVVKNPRDPAAFDGASLADPEIRRVSALTQLRIDEKMDALYPAHFAARVEVELNNSRQFERTVIDPHGTAADACDAAEIEAKFRLLANSVTEPMANAARADRVVAAVRGLHGANTVRELSAALHG